MPINRETFFAYARRAPFGGSLSQKQVDGCNILLDATEGLPPEHRAYILATAFHEVGRNMQPIAEIGRGRGRKYGVPGRNRGQIPYGRGYAQLTWDDNYERADRELGLNGALIRNYDLALRPDIAAKIIVRGMSEGWFTGKKLSDYFNGSKSDPVNARRIVNGTDKAKLIAGYYEAFLGAISNAMEVAPPRDVSKRAAEPDDVPPAKSKSVWAIGFGGVGAFVSSVVSAVSSPWGFATIALLVVAGGVAWYLVSTGRLKIERPIQEG